MRILKFIVNKQKIRPDPTCDFSGLIKGTSGYLKASFSFFYRNGTDADGYVSLKATEVNNNG